jgi:hypothetical protein
MFKRMVLVGSGLSMFWVFPLQAQNEHGTFSGLTFSMGAGVSAPLNPTAKYTGVSANFSASAGYKINKKSSLNGEFLWNGLPGSVLAISPTSMPVFKNRIYSLGANYRFQIDRVGGSVLGVYFIGGGGWYYRFTNIDKNYVIPANTPCQPIYDWWGYTCAGGIVATATVASKGVSAGGINVGGGFTVSFGHGFKFFTEARYHYAWTGTIPSTFIPVTMGLRFN